MFEKIKTWWNYYIKKARDPNMADAINWAWQRPVDHTAKGIVKLVEQIEKAMPKDGADEMCAGLLRYQTGAKLREFFHSLPEDEHAALALWGGCIIGAKVLATGTRNGENTKKMRRIQAGIAGAWAASNPVILQAIEAAVLFKHGRHELIHYAGIPKQHVLRNLKPGGYDGEQSYMPARNGKNQGWRDMGASPDDWHPLKLA